MNDTSETPPADDILDILREACANGRTEEAKGSTQAFLHSRTLSLQSSSSIRSPKPLKMQFFTLFIAAALAFLISASPAKQRPASSSKLAVGQIEKRGDYQAGCNFSYKLGNSYIPNPTGDGKSCFGFDNSNAITCPGIYNEEEIANIKKAVAEQVTKDGQWKYSDAGKWRAYFLDFTSAFDDRDTSAFDKTLDAVNVKGSGGAGQLRYYWQRNGNYLGVERHGCPRGGD
ncbi:MAG: hypothetical protein Q9171_003028 [Xanthocarpia ochracea]